MEIDLYKAYKERFGRQRKLNRIAVSVGHDESEIFYGLFRILMACDAVHDFCGSRGFGAKSDDMLKFVTQLTVELKNDLNVYNLVDVCEKLIRNDNIKQFTIIHKYFSTESNSKSISKRILNLFGLSTVPLKNIGQGDCTGDNSIIRMVKILNRSYDNNLPVELRVDATSNSSSLIPIYSSILEQSRRKASRCESYNELLFVKDISSEYDAATKDKLQKTLIAAEIVGDINKIEDTNYNIYCTVNGQPVNIVDCGLKSTKSGDKIIVTLNVNSYFNKDCSDINISNDLNNNSVEKLTKRAMGGENHYKYSVFKTMGDFLQIVSFLDSETYNKLYISFDILSSEICSLFSKFSFYEANESKERQNLINYGLYVYMTDEEINDQLVASGLMFLQREGVEFTPTQDAIEMAKKVAQSGLNYAQKVREDYLPTFATPISKRPVRGSPPLRPRSSPPRRQLKFGKKPKVSIRNTSTRVLKAKLKSVGVPVTKVVRGKRMKLTRKQLEMRAEAFKRLQIRCQKKGINLTYVSKKGRKYKSAKRLLSDLKRQPKFKPKPRPKSKMKWG
tara:strand:+ start:10556 stop:12238 length:1683 start_codon:yes stop_codon:yes gene_type:complete